MMKNAIAKKPFAIKRLFGKTLEQRRESVGYAFILPWIVGVSLFFLYPMGQGMVFLFNKVEILAGSMLTEYVGMDNLRQVFMVDEMNLRLMVENVGSTFLNAVLIVLFSLIVAVLINKPFRGRGFCRALLALPILVSSSVLMQVFHEDLFRISVESSTQDTMFQGQIIETILVKMGLSWETVWKFSDIVNRIMDLIWQSGIQILLFVAGMQAVPASYREVCQIEGATPWQSFWRVTFPLISPFLQLNFVFAVIDSFTLYSNPVIIKINEYFQSLEYSYGMALSMAYFIGILLLLGISLKLMARYLHQTDG